VQPAPPIRRGGPEPANAFFRTTAQVSYTYGIGGEQGTEDGGEQQRGSGKMNRMRRTCWMLPCLLVCSAAVWAAPPVDLELATEPGFPLGGERDWIKVLSELPDTNIRVRTARRGDRPEATAKASGGFRVVGILSARNKLHLPGGTYSINDHRALRTWLERLRNDGAEAHTVLKTQVQFATRDLPGEQFVEKMAGRLRLPLEVDPAAAPRLARGSIRDELSELSAGTALTIGLRPLGLAMTVKRTGGATRLRVVEAREGEETWPLGFATERSPAAVHPLLFKNVPFEISDTPLSEALAAIQQRLEIPMLFDHNGLAREGIDPAAVKVSLPAGRTYYKRIVDRLLSQAKLAEDLRIDEAGHPFLWIMSVRDLTDVRQ
jgi:hypothetical protein